MSHNDIILEAFVPPGMNFCMVIAKDAFRALEAIAGENKMIRLSLPFLWVSPYWVRATSVVQPPVRNVTRISRAGMSFFIPHSSLSGFNGKVVDAMGALSVLAIDRERSEKLQRVNEHCAGS